MPRVRDQLRAPTLDYEYGYLYIYLYLSPYLRESACVHCREKKELKTVQAKQSMDSVKAVSCDKTVKNKAERDR